MAPGGVMMGSMSDSCTWPVDVAQLPKDYDEKTMRPAVDSAVGVLWALTGRAYALCPVEARPCPPGTHFPRGLSLEPGPGWGPVIESGVIRNVTDVLSMACDRTGGVVLPGPVSRLLGMTVDGEDIAVESLVRRGDVIHRAAGQAWPDQDLTMPSGAPGTWSVRYLWGKEPPAGAAYVVAVLAREFYAAATGGKCQLPRRTQSIQRQGVSVNMVDPSDIYASGATGLSEVDLWIRAHNPYKLAESATVWSPDMGVW